MDKQEYLNQISAKSRPVKKSGNEIFASKIFWVAAIGIGIFILIFIISLFLGNGKTDNKDKLYGLILNIDNTSSVIGEYQTSVKSSKLRSDSASLNSILVNTSKELTDFIIEKYNFKDKDVKKSLINEETAAKDELVNDLFEAKINGILDSTYAYKMAYQISLIATRESQILKSANDDRLKEILTSSYNSLDNLYDKFNNFSEAN